jgi:hypothetical protein
MAKSIRVGKTRVGVSKSKRSDGRGSVIRLSTYKAKTNTRRK